ncbi:MAG: hypothetical protein CVV13_01705 [Gammaproteobacteria bacterium HGW-Gammaproteobacteria-3]|nr:MAG: hypothetical protein CVV13_01705 [Gammaproteobacteria bacterium HGW-Gammaproteobacteria-3]
MKNYAFLINESPVKLWGLSSRERLTRQLAQVGVTDILTRLDQAPQDAKIIIVRMDYLFPDRVLRTLVGTEATLLSVPAAGGEIPVAATVVSQNVDQALAWLSAADTAPEFDGTMARLTPETLVGDYDSKLRKLAPPKVLPISESNREVLENELFTGVYKGITDLITKWVWPRPARCVTRWCAERGIQPNHVTGLSLGLTLLAGWAFMEQYWTLGLAAAWIMTFLDTVDGKLARVTVTSSAFGNIFDHGIDLLAPPVWYVLWGLALGEGGYNPGIMAVALDTTIQLTVIGYIVGRVAEGAFQLFGECSMFAWRPFDSFFRLITARRNPNLVLLSVSVLAGRPDLGLLAVALWTGLSTVILLVRLGIGLNVGVIKGQPVISWLGQPEQVATNSLAADWFTDKQTDSVRVAE